MARKKILSANEVIKNLEKKGVVFTVEKNPVGKIKNFSSMIGKYTKYYTKD